MAAKKDLTGAINRGVDRLFSANDAQYTQEVEEVREVKQPRKVQEVSQEELTATIADMHTAIEADAERRAAAEERRTQGRKGFSMPRLNISLTPSGYEYVHVMARVNGKSVTRYISDLVDLDAQKNADRFEKIKEILRDE